MKYYAKTANENATVLHIFYDLAQTKTVIRK